MNNSTTFNPLEADYSAAFGVFLAPRGEVNPGEKKRPVASNKAGIFTFSDPATWRTLEDAENHCSKLNLMEDIRANYNTVVARAMAPYEVCLDFDPEGEDQHTEAATWAMSFKDARIERSVSGGYHVLFTYSYPGQFPGKLTTANGLKIDVKRGYYPASADSIAGGSALTIGECVNGRDVADLTERDYKTLQSLLYVCGVNREQATSSAGGFKASTSDQTPSPRENATQEGAQAIIDRIEKERPALYAMLQQPVDSLTDLPGFAHTSGDGSKRLSAIYSELWEVTHDIDRVIELVVSSPVGLLQNASAKKKSDYRTQPAYEKFLAKDVRRVLPKKQGHDANKNAGVILALPDVNTQYANVTGRKRRKHLIGGYAHRHSCVIASPGGEGKTTLACSWALILARVTGKWGNSDVDHGSVLYMAYEDGSGVKDLLRSQAHLFFGQQAEDVLANIRIVNAEEDSDVPPVNTPEGVKFIIEQVKELEAETGRECVAVFIDTLTKSAFNLDVNSNKDADGYENHLKIIRQKTGATSIVLAHTNKSDKGSLLGATNWRNHAASVLILNAEPGSTILRVFIDKMKNGKSKYYFFVDAPIFHTPAHVAALIREENTEEASEADEVDEFSCVNPSYEAPTNDGSTVRCVVHLVSHNSAELMNRTIWQTSPFLRRLRDALDGNALPLDAEQPAAQPQQPAGTMQPATAAATIGEALTQVLCGMGSGSFSAAQIKAAFNNWMQATGQQFNSVNNDRGTLSKELTKLIDAKPQGVTIAKTGEGRNTRYTVKVKTHGKPAPQISLNFIPQ